MADAASGSACLAALDAELARLRSQHELAMSRFLFDEASALQRRLAAAEDERRALALTLPPPAPVAAPEPPTGTVPVLARPRRRRR